LALVLKNSRGGAEQIANYIKNKNLSDWAKAKNQNKNRRLLIFLQNYSHDYLEVRWGGCMS
jgi:hypothetical protein